MGFNFRKSIKLGPARVNLSKSGVGFSVGAGGLRYTKSPKRKTKNGNTSKRTASRRPSVASHQETAPKAHELLTRSWFNAIFLAIVGFVVTAVVSFLAVLLLCVIVSIFARGFLSTIGANILIFGLPPILAALAARFAFLQYKPLKEDVEGHE